MRGASALQLRAAVLLQLYDDPEDVSTQLRDMGGIVLRSMLDGTPLLKSMDIISLWHPACFVWAAVRRAERLPPCVAVAAGTYHTCAITVDRKLMCNGEKRVGCSTEVSLTRKTLAMLRQQ